MVISFNFSGIYDVCSMLRREINELSDISSRLRNAYNCIEDMTLDGLEQDILNASAEASALGRELEDLEAKLKRIAFIYSETENDNINIVIDLPEGIPGIRSFSTGGTVVPPETLGVIADVNNDPLLMNTFSGHNLNNDDWLDELIFDWRDNRDEQLPG